MTTYLSDIITNQDLDNVLAGAFNILSTPRGWGKTTFMFDERIKNFARAKKHILYLVQNKATRESIAQQHKDEAVVFSDNVNDGWFTNRQKSLWTLEKDEDKIHVMCYQTFAALLRKEGEEWLGDIDLIIWDEFDDIKGYYDKEVKQLKKMLPNFSYERLIGLLQEGKPNSIVNFVYQIKRVVLDPAKIKLIAISATPENAAMYFRDYLNYILKGKLEEKFDAQHTIYIEDILALLKNRELVPEEGKKYWCYTKYIHDVLAICAMASSVGFNVLALWSQDNAKYRAMFTEAQREGLNKIINEGMVPPQYDFIITTGVVGRSVNVYDTSFQDWICNSNEYEDVGQFIRARFSPERQYLLESARGVVDFTRNGIAVDYYDWHSLDEIKVLLQMKPIYTKEVEGEKAKQLSTFAAVKKEYPDLFEKRRYGKNHTVQYRIKPAE